VTLFNNQKIDQYLVLREFDDNEINQMTFPFKWHKVDCVCLLYDGSRDSAAYLQNIMSD
jgi:hypothetical protein